MNDKTIAMAALVLLPRCAMYYEALKQARWQFKAAAGEHKSHWLAIELHLEHKIAETEQQIADCLEMPQYKGKKELGR